MDHIKSWLGELTAEDWAVVFAVSMLLLHVKPILRFCIEVLGW